MAQLRAEDDTARSVTAAWTTAALHRAKKMPTLSTLLAQSKTKRRPQSVDEQRAMLHILSQKYGIGLRKAKSGR